jgi:hypothetical protein
MHLLTFIQLRQPGLLFRGAVLLTQGIVFNSLFVAYLLSPKTCHRFVGYLEEEAVKTYTRAIADLDAGLLPAWKHKPAPPLAIPEKKAKAIWSSVTTTKSWKMVLMSEKPPKPKPKGMKIDGNP